MTSPLLGEQALDPVEDHERVERIAGEAENLLFRSVQMKMRTLGNEKRQDRASGFETVLERNRRESTHS
jgi:hypothetical protein